MPSRAVGHAAWFFLATLVPLAGCSSSTDTSAGAPGFGASSTSSSSGAGGGASTGAGGAGGAFDPGGDLTTYDTAVPPITVQPGDERTVCMTLSLGNPEGAFVRRLRADLDPGSHHMIVYRSTATQEDPTPSACVGFSGLATGDYPFFIAQQASATLEFPMDGDVPVGFEIDANQLVRVELHYINTTQAPLEVSGRVYADTIPLTADVVPSDFVFMGTTDIHLPPKTATSTSVKFQKGLGGTKTFALTTHQHRLGTRMRVWQAESADDIDHDPIADSTSWSDPPLVKYAPPLTFPTGDGVYSPMGFAYQCEWNNTTDEAVHIGESFNDEMCFVWEYYYPSKGFYYCLDGICQKQ